MYQKSILRSLVMDGGIALNHPARLRDLLAEQAQSATNLATIGTVGGGASMFLGLLMSAINPGALIALLSGGLAVYLGINSKATTAEEKEFRLLSKHGRIINLLGQYVSAGNATADEVLSAYESLVGCYLMAHDAIAYQGQTIPAAEVINQLPQMIQAQRNETVPMIESGLPPARKSVFGPSRLPKNAETFTPLKVQPTAPIEEAQAQPSPVALLERTITQPAPIGLPDALASVTVAKPQSTFIIGMSGAGKDIALFNIAQALKTLYPTALFVGIDGKNHAGELPLWNEALYDRTLHLSMLMKPESYHHRLIDLLKFACEWVGMVFVGFSELNGIAGSYAAAGMKSEWGEVAHYLRYLALQGDGFGKYLLSTAQGVTLDELGISTSARANIQFLMVGNATQFGFIDSITASTSVFPRKLIADQIAFTAACSRSTATEHLKNHNVLKGIAYFHTGLGRWEPMPRLNNPGVDRGNSLPENITPIVPHQNAELYSPPKTQPIDNDIAEFDIDEFLEIIYARIPPKGITLSKLKNTLSKAQRAYLEDELTLQCLYEEERLTFDFGKTPNGYETVKITRAA